MESLIQRETASLEDLYKDLHVHPELSYFEERSSKRMAEELRKAGYDVTEGIGKYSDATRTSYGVVGVLKNGNGPTVLVRTDLDALPVKENTELPYASSVIATNHLGEDVPVMHACGHDMHMTVFTGTARILSEVRDQWKGTLLMVAQPAEELGLGAKAMLNDNLYSRFPKPDYCLALHNDALLETGKVGWVEGYTLANVDTIDIFVRGVGGHGSKPELTKDPVVIASELVLMLQTIVSREVPPNEEAVVTVGSIHGGTKHNIIPDEVRLQLTVRSYKPEIRQKVLAAIERITKGVAQAAGVPADREPILNFHSDEYTPATYNDPELVRRIVKAWKPVMGEASVVERVRIMGGEDFGRFSMDQSIPLFLFWLGVVDPARVKSGEPLPYIHSSKFAPVPEPTIQTGIKAMTVAVLELMKK